MSVRHVPIPVGTRFGKLTVTGPGISTKTLTGKSIWKYPCLCDCGKESRVESYVLRHAKSCGCSRLSVNRYAYRPEYRVWHGMKQRCLNPNGARFHRYGGRGISVCDRWRNSFENFFKDMGPRPDGLTLDRIDNDGDYKPGNCRWATRAQQQSNRSANHMVEAFGERMNVTQWALRTGIKRNSIYNRLKSGWPAEIALSAPPNYAYQKRLRSRQPTRTPVIWSCADLAPDVYSICRWPDQGSQGSVEDR